MEMAAVDRTLPFQSVEALARLSEDVIRDSLGDTIGSALGRARTRIVILRSRLARNRKLFEAGLLREEFYFAEARMAGHELLNLTRDIAAGGGGPHASLGKEIATLIADALAAQANVVFISYRRDDSAYIADRVDQHLRSRLGTEAIFRDTQSIDYGDQVTQKINGVLARTRVCLVIIGRRWRGQLPDGRSRIDQLDDWVHREVRSALDRRITVVPVLTEGVRSEELHDLPEAIAGIRARQAFTLRPDPDFAVDMERLTSFVARRLV
jgi:TIR domain-containing protein